MSENAVKAGRGRPRTYFGPSELKCTVTGKVVKTNPTQFKKLVEKSGLTQEQVIASYVSREGRKIQKAQEASVPAGVPEAAAPAPKQDEAPAVDGSISGDEARKDSQGSSSSPLLSICIYPNRYLDEHKCCLTCSRLSVCETDLAKEWKK